MTVDTSTVSKQMSLARKCAKHGFDHKNWQEKTKSWVMVNIDIPTIDFDHLYTLCEESFGDDWVWSRDWVYGTQVYLMTEEDAVVFKLKYENLSKQVS